jgi:serine protease Do
VDAAGRLVGINTNRIGDGFYLAVPADAALRERVASLGRGESLSSLRLGVAVAPGHVARRLRRSVGLPDRDGLLVRGVEDGSLADVAGVSAGDLIVAVGGRPVADVDDLQDALAAVTLPFELAIVRGADESSLTVGSEGDAAG